MSLSILSWNILSGGFKDYGDQSPRPERLNGIVSAVQALHPDVVSLIDTYRWSELYSSTELARMFGYAVAATIKLNDERLIAKGHDNGLTVLAPAGATIESVWLATRHALRTSVVGIDIFSTYLDDLSEETRLEQTHALLGMVEPNMPTLIAGDLNTFAPCDLTVAEQGIQELAQKYPGPVASMEPVLREMERGEIVPLLEQHGFVDLGKGQGNTLPARLFPLPVEHPVARIDYAFASPQLACEEFKVLTDETFAQLSDHYPIWFKVH